MGYCKQYYNRMSFGKLNFDDPLILSQAVIPVSSINPGFDDLENAVRNILSDENYIADVHYNGIIILFNCAKNGPFSGSGGW